MKSNNQDIKKNSKLFGYNKNFKNFITLYEKNCFPKVSMLTGKKGYGKSSFIKHFLTSIFDKDNYSFDDLTINTNTKFYNLFCENLIENIIYLKGDSQESVKIDTVRKLKTVILKTTISNRPRFIIVDDVELLSLNSLNALLKILEEPAKNNFFILINNKTKALIETIKSRCIETRFFFENNTRINIIESLIQRHQITPNLDYKNIHLSPGNFLIFNQLCFENNIDLNSDHILNIDKLLKLYKKTKINSIINLVKLIIELSFYNNSIKDKQNLNTIDLKKIDTLRDINDYVTFNMNHNNLINSISQKIICE